ncbi:MAG: UDP-N-acetylmuramoyl-tripeptide--D-alanyl-D-alanine ligase [Verrucomicrobia bacterium]|nr:UDP-N-acetylmuramoyl-tripeptide--D-alanyl-D-alanine ligase [Verrucomicrobiota bacterium]
MRHVPIKKIAHRLGVVCESQLQVTGYQIDSRKIEPGELFFALKGKRVDGHQCLADARMHGAVGAVVNKGYQGPDYGLILLPVEDVAGSLQMLARLFMQECRAQMIGITGSVGKTTTKEFIATLLEGKYKVGKTPLNYNTKLTYPITLLNRTGEEEVLVVEMGMTEPGDIGRLVEIAAPDVGVFTKLAPAHKANFPRGLLDIAKYKAEIFAHPRTQKCIFDHALYQYPEAIQQMHGDRLSFSLEERTADFFLSSEYFVDERGVRAYRFDPPYKQAHFLHDFLAAVSVARQMKMSWDEIQNRISFLKLPKMRFEEIEHNGVLFINDAYNANPESMKAALAHLPAPKEGGKRIAVLGFMVDLGSEHDQMHREVGQFAQKHVDHLLILGKEASPIYEAFQEVQKPAEQYYDFNSLSERVKSLVRPGDVVLVKASRVVEMDKLFNYL